MTQYDEILRYCDEFGSISPMEAYALGITKLSTRVGEMSRMGIMFQKRRITTKNRYGRTVTYMSYSLRD